MSFLAPLYIIGLGALSLPILFHLIRRTPRGRQTFSTLMFLTPSPPRLTRRSRLDQWLLLLLRAIALALLAMAFARPFLREVADLSLDNTRGRHVAILLDTSASMQRPDVWQEAKSRVDEFLNGLETRDDVALLTFDDDVRVRVGFEKDAQSRQKAELVREQLATISPTWAATDLGAALVFAAETLAASEEEAGAEAKQLVVISDFQKGAALDELQTYEWPDSVYVSTEVITGEQRGNASIELLADDEATADGVARIRISNTADSTVDQFTLAWSGDGPLAAASDASEFYVPAGHSRVVQMTRLEDQTGIDRVILEGDAASFDNAMYLLPVEQAQVRVGYLGSDSADDPDSMQYYLHLAFGETVHRAVQIHDREAAIEQLSDPTGSLDLLVIVDALAAEEVALVGDYLSRGGTVLFVPRTLEAAQTLAKFSDGVTYLPSEPRGREDQYALLVDIDFTHPLFAPFANPRYGDFTQIHFWNVQQFEIDNEAAVLVLARFDTGAPAIWTAKHDSGTLYALASGWHPDDSELALSTKFVPLMNTLLDRARGTSRDLPSYAVNEAVALREPTTEQSSTEAFKVVKPDGSDVLLGEADAFFHDTTQPGVYSATSDGKQLRFTVNVAAMESRTEQMELGRIEQFGVRLGAHLTASEELERRRQKHNTELESSQKLWRWLIAVALCVLVAETWLAGRGARQVAENRTES